MKNKNVIKTDKEFLGKATDNQAEYNAIIKALKLVKSLEAKEISFFVFQKTMCVTD